MFDKIHINKLVINFGCCRRRVALGFAFGLPTNKERKPMPAEITLTNEQKVKVTLAPVTATGKPAQLDPNNKPTWTVVSGEATVQVADDGLSATIFSPDVPGDSQVLVEADADLGEGVETISDIVSVKTIGARAANLGLQVGTPEPK